MSIQALSEYTFQSRYARYNPEEKRRETWEEAVERVFAMHRQKYSSRFEEYPELKGMIDFAQKMQNKKRVLAAQRSLQFAGNPIRKHELKMFNCLTTHINRERVFQETMYSLLCGCGVGFSVQKHHVDQIGGIVAHHKGKKTFVVEDSIEGWAEAVGVLMNSYFEGAKEFVDYYGHDIEFDFSNIRPEGSLIAGQFKAPGPKGLNKALDRVFSVIEARLIDPSYLDIESDFFGKLRPIDCYDIIMHISDAVLSGGVRRSATLCLFSHDDQEMMNAKVGDWFVKNPQRGRSNNSAALLKGKISREEFADLMKSTRDFGEPGFVWLNNLEIVFNPCCEIGMIPCLNGESGWQSCNLTEINGKWCSSEENFFEACRASAIIGTLQAGYTNLKYLGKASQLIFEKEALLGCSITGWMDNPDILFNPETQRKGAAIILKTNEMIAKMIGINPTARATCVKPAGSTSCVLGTASGIHPHHAKRYIRRVQANKSEFCLHHTEKYNPLAVEESVWSANGTDKVISFLCEVPAGAIVKNQLGAVELLEKVKLTQQNWVEYGTVPERCIDPCLRHNVSNTITVKDDEWEEVEKYIFDNQEWFAGISLLSASGDLDYVQAPFSTVLTPNELFREYGDASVFASGLIVDGLHAFNDNLWGGCATVLGHGEVLDECVNPEYPVSRSNKLLAQYFADKEKYEICFLKNDWVRRVKQFADRYFEGNIKKATYCLKHVSLWKTWCDLKREYKEIDWSLAKEDSETYVNADSLAGASCSGNQCELI